MTNGGQRTEKYTRICMIIYSSKMLAVGLSLFSLKMWLQKMCPLTFFFEGAKNNGGKVRSAQSDLA